MSTCRDIIRRAYSIAGIRRLGSDPTSAELDAGLTVLQSIYDRIAESRDYRAVLESGTYEAGENERITGATTVNLPSVIESCDGDRAPKDMAFVQYDIGSGFVTYASDKGTWVALDDLAAGEEAPFSKRNSEGLSALVALEIAETYPGATVGAFTVGKARRWESMFARDETLEPEYF